jgi:hypothetical protein
LARSLRQTQSKDLRFGELIEAGTLIFRAEESSFDVAGLRQTREPFIHEKTRAFPRIGRFLHQLD